jgi:hypothetical protein
MTGIIRNAALGVAAAMGLLLPAQSAATGELAALAQLQHGRWLLRAVDGGTPTRAICLGDARVLLRLEHAGPGCKQSVVSSDSRSATVHYVCDGRGFTQTTLKVETPRLARIDTQGFVNNHPFSYRIEATRTGAC